MSGPRERKPFDPAAPLQDTEIVVGVGGGIAAYKACELVRLFTKAGARVQVIMTRRATKFVGPLTFQALTGRKVFHDLFSLTQESEIGHIQVADRADLVVVAPATANVVARLASGITDDALTAVCLATRAPVLLAPSMNVNMWQHPITQANLRRLIDVAGSFVVGPGDGFLACRWTGPGRLAEPADIVEAACRVLSPQDLAAKRLVITAGPTHEPLDPVRYLGNRSSGKMGYALAAAAARRGAAVTLVTGPTALPDPVGLDVVHVEDARAMEAALAAHAWGAHGVIMAAAVADFRPGTPSERKLKRTEIGLAPTISLESNPDLLGGLGAERARRGGGPLLVGFAAETHDVVGYARAKLAAKQVDLMVANDVTAPDAGFAVDTNRVVLVEPGGDRELPLAKKSDVAHRILDRIVQLLAVTAFLVAVVWPRAARAEPEFPTSKLIGPLIGIAWGPDHRVHLTGGIEGGVGLDELLVFNVGSTWRGDELFSYMELDGWYLLGGTVGFGHGTRDGWQPVVGVWEPLPWVKEIDPGCDEAVLVVLSVGYRYTGLHELYVTGKYGDAWTPCLN